MPVFDPLLDPLFDPLLDPLFDPLLDPLLDPPSPPEGSDERSPAQPVASAGQPLFAPSTARFGGPRQVQFGVRLVF